MGISGILTDFSGWTSCHGIPRIGGATNAVWRIFWILGTLACSGMLGWNTYILVMKFLSYGVTVGPTNKFQPMPFPAVTVCNMNSFLMSLTANIPSPFGYLINDYKQAVSNALYGIPTTTGSPQWDTWTFNGTNDTIVLQAKASQSIAYAVGTYNNSYRESLRSTSNLTSFILSCIFGSAGCSSSDWKETSNFFYTMCYTLNGAGTFSSVRAGPGNGLRMMFRTDQLEYQPWTNSAGAKVVIHSNNEGPFPTSFGYTAAPGLVTSYAMKLTSLQKKSSPYGKCTTGEGARVQYDPGTYSIEGCYRSCIQDSVVKSCGCASAVYPLAPGSVNCNYMNSTQYFCALKHLDSFDASTQCGCPEICTQSVWAVTVSTASWPAGNYIPSQCYKTPFFTAGYPSWTPYQPYPQYPGYNPSQTECVYWFNNNTGIIEIYYDSMDLRQLIEQPSYQLLNLVSDFGGQLGLWIGGSLITLFEFLAFIVMLFCFCKQKCCGSAPKPPPKNQVAPAEKPMLETIDKPEKPDLYNSEDHKDGSLTPPPITHPT